MKIFLLPWWRFVSDNCFRWFSRLAPSHDSSISRGRRKSRSTPENATLFSSLWTSWHLHSRIFARTRWGEDVKIFLLPLRQPLWTLCDFTSSHLCLDILLWKVNYLVLTFYVQWSCWLCLSLKTSRASLVVFVKKTHWKESSQGSLCCPTGDTSLIWATFSQRNLWQLKMTKIVTNLWSPKIQNHRRYWVEISGPDNLVPDVASGQTKNHLLFPFCRSQYFRGGVTEIGESEMEETRPAV